MLFVNIININEISKTKKHTVLMILELQHFHNTIELIDLHNLMQQIQHFESNYSLYNLLMIVL